MVYSCRSCSYRCPSWRSWLRHTFEAHSSEPGFCYTCGIDGCTSSFNLFSSLSSHLSRKHPLFVEPASPTEVGTVGTTSDCDSALDPCDVLHDSISCDSAFDSCDDIDSELEDAAYPYSVSSTASAKRSAALFLLTLKEKHKVTQTAIDFAVSQVSSMTDFIVQDIQSSLQHTLQEHLLDNNQLLPMLDECFLKNNPFEGLETEHKQSKFYRTEFGLIVSMIASCTTPPPPPPPCTTLVQS